MVRQLLSAVAGFARGHGRRMALAVVLAAAAGLASAGVPAQAVAAGSGPGFRVPDQACGLKFVAGALYIGGGDLVRRVNPRTGALTTVATGMEDPFFRGGACGVTLDPAGNVLVATFNLVRVAARRTGRFYGQQMTAGHDYTIVGDGGIRTSGQDGDGGPAIYAVLSSAVNVERDPAGNLVVADSGSAPVREGPGLGALVRVAAERTGRFYGRKMTAGDIYTVAGTWTPRPDSRGVATRTWLGTSIGPVRVDRYGNLVVADNGAPYVYQPGPTVQVVAVRSGRFYGRNMTAGHIYVIAGNGHHGSSGNGGRATRAALACAAGVALDHAGNVVIADCGRVRVVAVRTGRFYGQKMTAGHIYSIAGTGTSIGTGGPGGQPARRASINATAATVDRAGSVLIADALTRRVRVIVARTGHYYGRTMRGGDIYTIPRS